MTFTKEEWIAIGLEYLKSDAIADQLLEFIKSRASIDLYDLKQFHESVLDDLTLGQLDELSHDGLEKFYLDALVGYGFVAKFEGGWKYVRG